MNTRTITLINPTSAAVDASVVTTTDALFTTGTAPGVIAPGGSATLEIYFTADAEPGQHLGYLLIPAAKVRIPMFATTLEYYLDGGLGTGLETRWVTDDTGVWFEVGFLSPIDTLTGNAADGWMDPGGNLIFRLERSEDLVNWDYQWTDATGSPEGPDGEGDYKYWARSLVPRLWKYVTIDLTAESTRYGKSITNLKLFGATISLPNYPYAMPADAATLQADLVSAGYTGSVVSSTSAALSVEIIRHWWDGALYRRDNLAVTLSGSDVTMVKTVTGSNISLPSYPYTMPADQAALQADLITAGQTGACVRLFADEWTILIPDRDTTLSTRDFLVTFTPGDPHAYYNMFGGYSVNPDATVGGQFSNLRSTSGFAPLEEADKQFPRLGVSRGPNYQFD